MEAQLQLYKTPKFIKLVYLTFGIAFSLRNFTLFTVTISCLDEIAPTEIYLLILDPVHISGINTQHSS